METLQDPGPSVVTPSISHSLVGVLHDHVGVGLDVMEMLQNMPNNETLKELLESSTKFVQLCQSRASKEVLLHLLRVYYSKIF